MRLAGLDVGSNTVLMVVAEVLAGGGLSAVAEFSRITRLGKGVDLTGKLDPQTAAQTCDAIADFVTRARELGADKILTAATSALRDAKDGPAFIDEVERQCGVRLTIIPGADEARLNYLAAVHGLSLDLNRDFIIADIGGGSTEFIQGRPGAEPKVRSLQIGSVRLTERLIAHDPPSAAERQALNAEIDSELAKLNWGDFAPAFLVGVAGTVTTVCAVALDLEGPKLASLHGRRLRAKQVHQAVARLFALTTRERAQLPGVAPGRADVICAGAAILERAVEFFRAPEVLVSDQGVRWGLLYRELESSAGAQTNL